MKLEKRTHHFTLTISEIAEITVTNTNDTNGTNGTNSTNRASSPKNATVIVQDSVEFEFVDVPRFNSLKLFDDAAIDITTNVTLTFLLTNLTNVYYANQINQNIENYFQLNFKCGLNETNFTGISVLDKVCQNEYIAQNGTFFAFENEELILVLEFPKGTFDYD